MNKIKNWKTTSAGILSIAGGIILLINNKSAAMEGLTSILAGIGLLFAADSSNPANPTS